MHNALFISSVSTESELQCNCSEEVTEGRDTEGGALITWDLFRSESVRAAHGLHSGVYECEVSQLTFYFLSHLNAF